MLAILAVIGLMLALAWPYYAGLAAAAAMVVSPLAPDPRPHARRLLQGLPPQQLDRRGDLRRHRAELPHERDPVSRSRATCSPGEAARHAPDAASDLPGPSQRQRTWRRCRSPASTAVRVAFQRDARQLGWGIGLRASPRCCCSRSPGRSAASRRAERDVARGHAKASRALQAVSACSRRSRSMLPVLALACVIGGGALVRAGLDRQHHAAHLPAGHRARLSGARARHAAAGFRRGAERAAHALKR